MVFKKVLVSYIYDSNRLVKPVDLELFKETICREFEDDHMEDWTDISSWSSMQKLLVITAIYENFELVIEPVNIKNSTTIEDLYRLINNF